MAALAQDYRKPEPFEVPEGGLASFLTATTGEWAEASNDDYIPETGIAGVKAVANKLAEYGRYEDEYMVHAAEGETVIPAQVLDLNPRLKAKLFKEMRDMGLEPERYVVGNELNSLNPVTGQPEFFLKKLFKGIKKAVKKVVKVLKKAATVVLPIALSFTPLGPIYGAALGSGLGTLIQGGNLKDALKSALISGATGALSKGFTGKGTFGENISKALSSPGERFSQLGSALTGDGKVFTDFAAQTAQAAGGATPTMSEQEFLNIEASNFAEPSGALPPGGAGQEAARLAEFNAADPSALTAADQDFLNIEAADFTEPPRPPALTAADQDFLNIEAADFTEPPRPPAPTTAAQAANMYDPQSGFGSGRAFHGDGFFDSMGQGFSNLSQGNFSQFIDNMRQAFLPSNFTADNVRDAFSRQFGPDALAKSQIDFTKLAAELASSEAAPNIFRRYLPMIGLTTGALAATGGFEAPEMEPLPDPYGGVTGMDLLAENRGLYAPGVFDPRSLRTAAGGGDITHFPRRDGAIYGPGTETSDDIPAMLSDGEFVMTARAVRGAGNGDREQGMQRMYDIMRRFEGGAIRG